MIEKCSTINIKQNKFNYKTNQIKCDHCGCSYHIKANCYFYKKSISNSKQNSVSNNYKERKAPSVSTVNSIKSNNNKHFAFMIGHMQNLKKPSIKNNEIRFLLDSGATDHFVNKTEYFSELKQLDHPLEVGVAKENTSLQVIAKGTINVITKNGVRGVIENVLYAPDIPYNILSVCRIQQKGMSVHFEGDGDVTIKQNNEVLVKDKQLADVFTKQVPAPKFREIIFNLGLEET